MIPAEIGSICFNNESWLDCSLQPFIDLVGEPVFLMLLGVPLTVALWWQTQEIAVPAVVVALFAGILIAGVPAQVAIIAYLLVAAALVMGLRNIAQE